MLNRGCAVEAGDLREEPGKGILPLDIPVTTFCKVKYPQDVELAFLYFTVTDCKVSTLQAKHIDTLHQ